MLNIFARSFMVATRTEPAGGTAETTATSLRQHFAADERRTLEASRTLRRDARFWL